MLFFSLFPLQLLDSVPIDRHGTFLGSVGVLTFSSLALRFRKDVEVPFPQSFPPDTVDFVQLMRAAFARQWSSFLDAGVAALLDVYPALVRPQIRQA